MKSCFCPLASQLIGMFAAAPVFIREAHADHQYSRNVVRIELEIKEQKQKNCLMELC